MLKELINTQNQQIEKQIALCESQQTEIFKYQQELEQKDSEVSHLNQENAKLKKAFELVQSRVEEQVIEIYLKISEQLKDKLSYALDISSVVNGFDKKYCAQVDELEKTL